MVSGISCHGPQSQSVGSSYLSCLSGPLIPYVHIYEYQVLVKFELRAVPNPIPTCLLFLEGAFMRHLWVLVGRPSSGRFPSQAGSCPTTLARGSYK